MIKYLYIAAGFIFLGIGAVGIVLPVLPTTPFLLLSTYYFAKGSDKLHRWFMTTELYKNHVDKFLANRSLQLKSKIMILSFATFIMTISFFAVSIIYLKILLVVIAMYMYYYFFAKIKTETTQNKDDMSA